MYFIPLIFFCGLTYYLWKSHNSFDLSVYMSVLYTITSLCCTLMVIGGFLGGEGGVLIDGWDPEFGIIPTVLYCSLITLTIIPFSTIRTEKLENIGNRHKLILYAFSLLLIIQGLLIVYLVIDSIGDLLNGDFKYLKDSHYKGDISPADAKMLTMPMPVQILYLFSYFTILGLPLFFYYSCVEKLSLWLTFPLLIVSISPVLRGVIMADRTEIIHFGLMFLFCIIFFKNLIQRKVRRFLAIMSIPVLTIGIVYVIAVSASRFENNDDGTGGSMLEYTGQPYINFCYFYDNHNYDLYYLEREFPITSYLFFKSQYTETKEERTAAEGFFVGVFATHVGSWLLDSGIIGSITFSGVFALICVLIIKRHNRKEFDIAEVLMLFTLGTIPTFGIFYYRFYSVGIALQYLATIIIYILSKITITWAKQEKKEDEILLSTTS